MAFFDPAEQRMGVRVVYDGVARSGKTTNLRQLCALFATQRTTELYTPAELDGRTLYFDWAQFHAGVVPLAGTSVEVVILVYRNAAGDAVDAAGSEFG